MYDNASMIALRGIALALIVCMLHAWMSRSIVPVFSRCGRFIGATAFLLPVLFASSTARADAPNHDKAVVLFNEAGKLIDAGNCDAAIPKLRESLEAESSVGARLALATCFEPRDPIAAWRLLKDAAALARANHDTQRVAAAESLASVLEKKVPTFKVVIPDASLADPSFELKLDGHTLDHWYYASGVVAAPAGPHVLEAHAPGQKWVGVVTSDMANPGVARVVLEKESCAGAPAVAPSAPAAAPVVKMDDVEPKGAARRAVGLSLAGLGVGGVATGVVFGVLTLQKKNDIQKACGGSVTTCNAPMGSVDVDRQDAKTMGDISTVSFIVGGVALVSGAALYFTAPSAVTTGKVRVAPTVSKNDAGLMVVGAF
jgi:hypothetical protein